MAKITKEFEWQTQGLVKAQDIVKTEGAEALDQYILYRGLTRAPINVTQKQMDDFIRMLGENLFTTVKTVSLVALKDEFGFGTKRMRKFEEKFKKLTMDACDMDWIGSHYVTMTDYAEYLQKENGIEVKPEVLERCQRDHDQTNPGYKRVGLERLVAELAEHGFEDAAAYLLERFAG